MQTIILVGMLIFVVFIWLTIVRPQRKANEKTALMVASVKVDSIVYAGGGIRGKVVKLRKDGIIIETSSAKTRILIDSDHIESVEGFDYSAEKARQKELRKQRLSKSRGR